MTTTTTATVDPATVQAAPRFLVSFSFQARNADAAQAMTDAVREAMQTAESLPVFDDLAFHAPVQVGDVPTAPWSRSVALILDMTEQSTLLAALMDALDNVEDGDVYGEGDKERTAEEQAAAYRALSDKLLTMVEAADY